MEIPKIDTEDSKLPQANVKGGGFRAPRLDFFVTKLQALEDDDSINRTLIEKNAHPSSVISIEIKFVVDTSVNSKDAIVIVFYKTKVEGTKFRIDHFYTTVGRVEDEDYINKYTQLKGISVNDIVSIVSARCKKEAGRIPEAILIVHYKRQSNGADLA